MEALQTNEQLQTNVKSISIDVDDLLRNKSYMITCEQTIWRIKFEQIAFKHYRIPFPQIFMGSTEAYDCINAITKSHYNAISLAQELDLSYILVFEDDAYPCTNAIKHLNNALNDIPANINMLSLGYSHFEDSGIQYINKNNIVFQK